jgi:hypothetical protein
MPVPTDDRPGAGNRPSHRSRWVAVVAPIVLVVALGVGAFVAFGDSGPSGFSSASAASIALFAAAQNSGSFHYAGRTTGSEGGTVVTANVSGDAGRTEGIQYLTSNVATYEVIVINSSAYMKPDINALENQFGYPASVAATYANRWIALTPSDAPYKGVAEGVTSGSDWDDASHSPVDSAAHTPQSVSPVATVNGRSLQTVTYSMSGAGQGSSGGRFAGHERIVFNATAPHVPYSVTQHLAGTADRSPATNDVVATFSNWGEPVSVTAPSGAIPFSSLPPVPTSA